MYVFGSESHGVRPELEKLVDKKYTIPGRGSAESLNVAVACGIVLAGFNGCHSDPPRAGRNLS